MLELVNVTAPVGTDAEPAPPAKASPTNVPPVTVMSAPAKTAPRKFEPVRVVAWATHQYTFGQVPAGLPGMTTEKLVAVKAPVPPVPILKIHTPSAGPSSVNVPVNVAAAGKQYTPGESVTPASVPVNV